MKKHLQNLHIDVGNEFFGYDTKSVKTKANISKLDCIKLKSFCRANNEIRILIGWEKRFANHLSNKGLISKLYLKLIQINGNNNNDEYKNSLKDRHKTEEIFPNKDIQKAYRYAKRCSTYQSSKNYKSNS